MATGVLEEGETYVALGRKMNGNMQKARIQFDVFLQAELNEPLLGTVGNISSTLHRYGINDVLETVGRSEMHKKKYVFSSTLYLWSQPCLKKNSNGF